MLRKTASSLRVVCQTCRIEIAAEAGSCSHDGVPLVIDMVVVLIAGISRVHDSAAVNIGR
mgnify:CR=1 FL=1